MVYSMSSGGSTKHMANVSLKYSTDKYRVTGCITAYSPHVKLATARCKIFPRISKDGERKPFRFRYGSEIPYD